MSSARALTLLAAAGLLTAQTTDRYAPLLRALGIDGRAGGPELAVLNAAQRAKLAHFKSDLELAREAAELRLIRVPRMDLVEALCR